MASGHSVTFESHGVLEFESDDSIGGRGFEATFKCVPAEESCRQCDSVEYDGGPGFGVRCGDPGSPRCDIQGEPCRAPTETHAIQCCSDRRRGNWKSPAGGCDVFRQRYPIVYQQQPQCPPQVDFSEVQQVCAVHPARQAGRCWASHTPVLKF